MKYEVGVVHAHPLKMIWRQSLTIWRTWRYAKALGLRCDRWYGVYATGTEIVYAHTGPLPTAQSRAQEICDLLNRQDPQ